MIQRRRAAACLFCFWSVPFSKRIAGFAGFNPRLQLSLGNGAEELVPLRAQRRQPVQNRLRETEQSDEISRTQRLREPSNARLFAGQKLVFVHIKVPKRMGANINSPLRVIGRNAFGRFPPCPTVDVVRNGAIPQATVKVLLRCHRGEFVWKREAASYQKAQRPGIIRLNKEDVLLGYASHFS